MTGHVKRKYKDSDRSSSKHKKKRSRHSSSDSNDYIIVDKHRSLYSRDKRQKNKQSAHQRRYSNNSGSSNLSYDRINIVESCRQLLGERPEFCRYKFEQTKNGMNIPSSKTHRSRSSSKMQGSSSRRERSGEKRVSERFSVVEQNILYSSTNNKDQSRKRKRKDVNESVQKSKKSKKSHKRRYSRSSSSSSSSSSRSSSSDSRSSSRSSSTSSSSSNSSYEREKKRRKKKKLAKKLKKEQKRQKSERKKSKKPKEKIKTLDKKLKRAINTLEKDRLLKDISLELADRAKAMAPMTKEQWEKKQSIVRKIYDETTGRERLIKGDGEVLEEIVSRDRHKQINKTATKGDGQYFQSYLGLKK